MKGVPEACLAGPAAAWLRSRGCTVYAEVQVPNGFNICDLVGVMPCGRLIAIELKSGLTRRVIEQAMLHQVWAHEAYAGCAARPAAVLLEHAEVNGVGVLRIADGAELVLGVRAPFAPGYPLSNNSALMRTKLRTMTPSDRGGVASSHRGRGI